ncbi:MAG: DNAase [Acidobacteria bacterium RIFCSPLOWO2_02_FULL_59_13]|nr:MAG: DNAase [Acidobacteria bacterium RIFCSPLOWO2_02_FULL_59_13]
MITLVDSHCHLDFPELAGQLESVFALMRENQVERALCVSVTLEDFPRVRRLAEVHAHIYASVGVHPDHEGVAAVTAGELVRLADHPRVVAIGETGLDYFRLKGDLEWQRERFRTHIRAARECGKPLIIHSREAAADTLRIMAEEGAGETGGVMHCFTESWEVAEAAIAMGFYVSFSGIVTFKNAKALKEVARRVPLEKLLVETDAPYLAPMPHRGKTNQPGYVRHVAEEIARLKGVTLDRVADSTTENFFKLFNVARNA